MARPDGLAASSSPTRLCYVITSTASLVLLRGQLARMRREGYDVTLVSSPGKALQAFCENEGVAYQSVPMRREISPLDDLLALLRLTWLLMRLRPAIVNASTPKAGLLGAVAAALAGVPGRVYVLRGLRLETTRGWKRRILWLCEWLTCRLATRVVCVSPSLRDAAITVGILPRARSLVIGSGSSNGIETARFPRRGSAAWRTLREAFRRQHGLPIDGFVFGFVGRLTRDKGVEELVSAFQLLGDHAERPWLVLAGEREQGDAPSSQWLQVIERGERIVTTGQVESIDAAYAAFDVLVHPSKREGFGNAPAEASASGLPVVGRRVTGVVDAVLDNQTGRLVPSDRPADLSAAMRCYLEDAHLRATHGEAGRARMEREFAPDVIWDGLLALYAEIAPRGDSMRAVREPERRQAA